MKRSLIAWAVVAALILAMITPMSVMADRDDDDKARRLGAAIGLAIGIAALKEKRKREERRAERGRTYSPARDVLCIPKIEQCYKEDRYSARWTHKEFGYR